MNTYDDIRRAVASCKVVSEMAGKTPFEVNSKKCSKFNNIITREEAETLVKNSISTDAKLVDYYLHSYSEEKLGFLGAYFGLVVVAQRPNYDNTVTCRFFVKTMPFDVPTQFTLMQERGYFDKEVGFFRRLVPMLMNNFKGDSWAPVCYLAKENVLVFEDLNTKGFANGPKLLDEQSVKASLASIARMHAASLLAEERNNG